MPRIYNLYEIKSRRQKLRWQATSTEIVLWHYLRLRRFRNLKFRRQYSVGRYILDFYCPAMRLGIEIDGGHHLECAQAQYDAQRDQWLGKFGIKIFRVLANEVNIDVNAVLEALGIYIDNLPPTTPGLRPPPP